ncbi:LLM class F420-dependent oxidoreductase [Actinobacteria bacterium YIM 96077]|uniref:LLM class F420-dependent oxidoreductase n=1 Tax=Phytoactinopolyspora halophila TaxID=1981511 RepID=A0A329QKL0_9ACTN|nr:LLM class F420-dependent oxidoreductase [Actinobacteria bacterium YIM 96077]RAW11942.1 LLM class F420-dependent oxidoreductase [Phytoactinopolyspora halophila]
MRVDINITNYSWPQTPGAELSRIVQRADDGGLDTVWVADHLLQVDPTSTLEAEMLEAYTTLGFLAGQSQHVRLGTMVSAATYRPPALLIKAVTTLDVLSNGRAWLGIGSGYSESECQALGLPLPPVSERFARLDEILRLALQMWTGDESPFEGSHYQLERPVNIPQPVSQPHPPILIGGMGENKTLRMVARHADACNLFDVPDGGATLRHKLSVLAKHCDAEGRAYSDITTTVSTRFEPGEAPSEFADRCHALRELGFEHVVAIRSGPWTVADVTTLAKARELLAKGP